MSTLYIIRHAESEANKDRILASRLPISLTAEGKADADKIASELKELVRIDRIISSPLVRARQTAESFSTAFGLSVEEEERIIEQELGMYSGMSYDQVKEEEAYQTDTQKRWDWVPAGGGESYSMIADRILSFFQSLEEENREENILIVTHAVSFRLIRAVLENTLPSYPSKFPNNGEIWKIEFSKLGEVHQIESIFLGDSRKFVHNP